VEIVVNDPEAFPGVVAPVSPAHQELNHQTHVNQSDLVVRRQVALQGGTAGGNEETGSTSTHKTTLCTRTIYLFKPLFNQVNPIEIKNLFFTSRLDKTGNDIRNTQLQIKTKHRTRRVKRN